MSSTTGGLLAAITAHVATVGDRPPARRAAARWASSEPALAGLSPADVLAGCTTSGEVDRLVGLLAPLCPECEWAALTALAALAGRLRQIVATWAARGCPPAELADAEAELVAHAWAALRQPGTLPPGRPPASAVVGRAWSATRLRRASELRRSVRQTPLTPDLAAVRPATTTGGPTVEETVTAALVTAVGDGRVTRLGAAALYATRVAGHPAETAAAAWGTTAGTIRVLRARTASRLLDGWAA